ncbi:MAG: hypothetical protein ABJE10_05675 [bacterium]
MTVPLTLAAIRDRFITDQARESDGQHTVTRARLTLALDAIGWRAADGLPAEEVADIAAHIVENCVTRHHDLAAATRQLAELLHSSAATLDGSMSSATMFLPAAREILERYAGSSPV